MSSNQARVLDLASFDIIVIFFTTISPTAAAANRGQGDVDVTAVGGGVIAGRQCVQKLDGITTTQTLPWLLVPDNNSEKVQ